jgi:DNA (cytosine-5)-methyltransferase 1
MSNVSSIEAKRPKALEFFAGIGLARVGLERAGFRVVWANDFEPAKKEMYDNQFTSTGSHKFVLGDIGEVDAADIPAGASVAWASSPCTDLSLAGSRAGLHGPESGTFWQFSRILRDLGTAAPPVVVLENVIGLATSHGGDDITAAVREFNDLGYSVDALMIDTRRFLPQSRPRLFLVGAKNPPAFTAEPDPELRPAWLLGVHSDPTLMTHQADLPKLPGLVTSGLSALIEDIHANDELWWNETRVDAFVSSLSPVQLTRLDLLRTAPTVTHRTAYRRTRNGIAVWEMRPDDISGCLRTARGGSSKQAVVKIGRGTVSVRWMTPREYARLMGAGDYNLDGVRTNQALFGFGDAVAVPAVEWLSHNYLMPMITGTLAATVEPMLLAANV